MSAVSSDHGSHDAPTASAATGPAHAAAATTATVDAPPIDAARTAPTAPSAPTAPTVHLLGNILTLHASASLTEGAFTLTHARTAPGAGTPPHVHADAEGFYVLAGRYGFVLGESNVVAGPGEFVFVPAGTPHAFRNVGDAEARMLILNAPGGAHEAFFLEAGDPVDGPDVPMPPASEPDLPRLGTAAAKNGIAFVEPA